MDVEKKGIETRERAKEVFCVWELLNFFLFLQATTAYIVQKNKKNQKMGQGVGLYYTSTVSLSFTHFALAFLFISIAVLCRGGPATVKWNTQNPASVYCTLEAASALFYL